ncbi:hypothetical protein HYALB_00004036 [Hymenoscyphus albidus]|uniref:Hydrophobin n=1 Tax=Hymenoscyphus albidus TaxID=595503 RepID=A0A9N9M0H1_9HELO|nr:hypothetical protein HYALB_00004036 [Hymenoscyphus albidus]
MRFASAKLALISLVTLLRVAKVTAVTPHPRRGSDEECDVYCGTGLGLCILDVNSYTESLFAAGFVG